MSDKVYQERGRTYFNVRMAIPFGVLAAAYRVDSDPKDMRQVVDAVVLSLVPEQMSMLQAEIEKPKK